MLIPDWHLESLGDTEESRTTPTSTSAASSDEYLPEGFLRFEESVCDGPIPGTVVVTTRISWKAASARAVEEWNASQNVQDPQDPIKEEDNKPKSD